MLSEVSRRVLEPWDFELQDVENLRMHYARTLAHWRARFEGAWPELARRSEERFLRSWRVYLAGSEIAFRTGYLQLFQVQFARAQADNTVRTRGALYGEPMRDEEYASV